jgi:hypothetical protein
MINLNVNRIEARLNRPAPLLVTPFDYYVIAGGGGGGNSPDGAIGGNGGSGGAFSSGSFDLSHGVTATIDVGAGGNAPADLNNGTIGTNGADSKIIVGGTPIVTATGGTAANITSTTAQTGQKADDYLGFDAYGRNGSRGTSDPETPIAGVAGGNNTEFANAWGGTINDSTNVVPSPNMGGGGRGAAYDNTLTNDRAGAGADGFVSVRVFDPINAFDVDTTGTVEVINDSGYRYFYFLTDGTLQINRKS